MECDGPYPQMDMQIVLPLCWGPFRLKVPSDVSIKQALGIVDLQRFADACFVQGRQISANAMTHTLRGTCSATSTAQILTCAEACF